VSRILVKVQLYLHKLKKNFIVYPLWWVNQPPIITGTQYQQAWSRTFGVNILAAGTGLGWLYSGSGIYSQGKTLTSYFNPTTQLSSRLLIADVPTLSSPKPVNLPLVSPSPPSKFHWPTLQFFKTTPGTTQNLKATDGVLTCSAQVKISVNSTEADYALVVYAGYYYDYYYEELCAIVKCLPEEKSTCYDRTFFTQSALYTNTAFDAFEIEGTFSSTMTLFGMASGNNSTLLPIDYFSTQQTGSMSSETKMKNQILLNASLFGVLLTA